jgi:predicted CopG family antitoxin
MANKKMISVEEDLHTQLSELKLKWKKKRLSEVVEELVRKAKNI